MTQTFSQSTLDAGNDFTIVRGNSPRCAGSNSGSTAGDHVYRVSVPAGSRVLANLDAPGGDSDGGMDSILNIAVGLANCGSPNPDGGADTVVVCAAGQDDPEPQTLKYKNVGPNAAEAYILVDGYSNGRGPYTLNVDVGPTPASDDCDTPTPLIPGTPITNQSLAASAGFANDFNGSGTGCASASTGVDRVYSLTVPTGSRATITVTPSPMINTSISIAQDAAACGTRTCLANMDNGTLGAPDTLTFLNNTSNPQSVLVIVDTSTVGGTFDIDAVVTALPAGDNCGNALLLDAGTVNGSLVGYTNDYFGSSGCAGGTAGPDSVWQTSVPPGSRLTATLAPSVSALPDGGTSLGFRPTLNFVVGTCTDRLSCVAGANASLDGGPASAVYDNVSGASQTVQLVVDTSSSSPMGTYALTTTVGPVTLPVGDHCGNVAAPITTDTMLTGETLVGYGNNWNSGTVEMGCAFGNGPDRVYAVTVPTNTRLTAIATSGATDLMVNIVDGAAPACLANPVVCATSAVITPISMERARFDNTSGAPKTVLVIVDRPSGALLVDAFDLGIGLSPAPMTVAGGESCGAPVSIGANTTILSTTVGMMNNYSFETASTCVGVDETEATEPDSVFATTVPANSRLTVTATPNPYWDMTLNVLAAPATNCGTGTGMGAMCLAGSDTGRAESVTVVNPAMMPLDVLILVDGYGTDSNGPFELTTSTSAIPPPVYTKTTVPQACDTMTSATVLLSSSTTPAIADDVASPTAALPFAFSFFSAPVTHYSANSNGLLQFFSTDAGVGLNSYSNDPIPTNSPPNGFAAPFWDDLMPAATGVVRSQASGTAPNRRMTVEWADESFYGDGGLERLRFQAKVFETTNVIEFHYCSMTAIGSDGGMGDAMRTSGGSATVGLENDAGSAGLQHSYNTPNSVDTTNALRFTP